MLGFLPCVVDDKSDTLVAALLVEASSGGGVHTRGYILPILILVFC